MILSHLSRLGPVVPKTAPHSGQWIDLIQLSSVSILCLGEQLALLIKACQRGSECGVSKKRTSESTSDRGQQASTMTMKEWQRLAGQHNDHDDLGSSAFWTAFRFSVTPVLYPWTYYFAPMARTYLRPEDLSDNTGMYSNFLSEMGSIYIWNVSLLF